MLLRLLIIVSVALFVTSESEPQEPPDVVADDEKEIEIEEIPYTTPRPIGNAYLAEHFDDREEFGKKWIPSEAKKDGAEDTVAKYDGKWAVEEAEKNGLSGDLGLVLKSKAHHHAIAARLEKPFLFDNKPFILQYEVRFQNGQECGGAYLKLLSQVPNVDLRSFHDKTPYTLMFGPDKCGNDHKLHFIFRHRNPKNGTFEEKHWKRTTSIPKFDDVFKDKKPHLFTLIINPDNKFEVKVDKQSIHKGNLLEDFQPPVNPEAEIDDPTDVKPSDWDERENPPVNPEVEIDDSTDFKPSDLDEREKIPDPIATKPADWDEDAPRQILDPNARKPAGWLDDEPELIPDPNAEKPTDWDDEMDGEWEAPLITNPKCEKVGCGKWKPPMIDNPKYKGKWRPALIDNPSYKGKWKPKRISNPHYFEDKYPYKMTPIAAVGFELWSMVDGIMFDNLIITDELFVAEHWASETFDLKRELADRETTWWKWLLRKTNNHPYVWLLYLSYCAIPILLYFLHLRSRVKEDNMITRLFKYTNKNPWLWAVYLVVIGLPVVLFISFCCTSTRSPAVIASQKELEAKRKAYCSSKSFGSQAEDKSREIPKEASISEIKEEEEEELEEQENVEEEIELLDNEVNESKKEAEVVGVKDKSLENEDNKVEDEEESDEANADEEAEQEADAGGEFPRRRRPRKE